MNRCLFCHENYVEPISWRQILLLELPSRICPECAQDLKCIEGERCVGCSRSLSSLHKNHVYDQQCSDCMRWQQNPLTQDLLERNVSLYEYDEFSKEIMTNYKFRGDAVIASYFAERMAEVYKKEYVEYLPVELPLSHKRLQSRTFNQSTLLMEGWAEETGILIRYVGEKQSKRNRRERISQVNNPPFSISPNYENKLTNKKVVLIDDIYTTGTTVRQAAKVLKEHGVERVSSLTVAR